MPAPRFKGKTPFTTNYQDDFCSNRSYLVDQARVVPAEPGRNNPHPMKDFINSKGRMNRVDPMIVKDAVREYMDNLMTASRRTYDDEYTPYMDTVGQSPVVMKSHIPQSQRELIGSSMSPTMKYANTTQGQYANDTNQRKMKNNTQKVGWEQYTRQQKPKSEQPHWIVWKTGATPDPSEDYNMRDTEYVSPPPPIKRPRAPAPPENIYTGEAGLIDDTHEALGGDVEPCFQDIPGKHADGYSTFVPGFRSWISGGEGNYDKEAVYSMLKKINGSGRTGDIRHRSLSASQMRPTPPQTKRSTHSASARYEHPINFERRAINTLFKNIGSHPWMYGFTGYSRHLDYGPNALLYRGYQPPKTSWTDISNGFEHMNNNGHNFSSSYDRPTVRHMYRQPTMKNYAHENSFFMNSKPTNKSHFIINPEWVSENRGYRKKLAHMKSGPNSLRYGSK